jgi:creatinine amidohydrolase
MHVVDLNNTEASKTIGKIRTLLLPVGTLEAHGPHCSVATDTIIPEKLADEVDRMAKGRVLVGPSIHYGHTWRLKNWPGSLDISRKALADYVFEVIRGYGESWKIKYALIINGHGGNIDALHDAAERAAEIGIKTVVLSWWVGGFLDVLKQVVADPEGHAGEAETSLMMHAGERYVDKTLIPTKALDHSYKTVARLGDIYDSESNHAAYPQPYSGNPTAATLEKGKILNEKLAKEILRVVDQLESGNALVA